MPKKEIKRDPIIISLIVKRMIMAFTAGVFLLLILILIVPREPEIIKGVSYDLSYAGSSHYSQVPASVFENDFAMMKKSGVNTVRFYSTPPDFIFDLAQKFGLKLIVTVSYPGDWTDFSSPHQLKALKRDVVQNVRRCVDEESILAWCIWNDAPWRYGSARGDVVKTYGRERVEGFLQELYRTVKKEDPVRPVVAATLLSKDDTKTLGASFLDMLGYNVYLGVKDWITGGYDLQLTESTLAELRGISREYEKPVLIMETGYSTYWKAEDQGGVIADQLERSIKAVDGVVLFQWADNWSKAGNAKVRDNHIEEHWGLLEGDRKKKKGYPALGEAYRMTALGNILFEISDYFRGTYFAARNRLLEEEWEDPAYEADRETEILLRRMGDVKSPALPGVLKDLAERLFSKRAFSFFISRLDRYRDEYRESGNKALADYYTALTLWKKLKYIEGQEKWSLYYAEKTRTLDRLKEKISSAKGESRDARTRLEAIYLEWTVHDSLLTGREDSVMAYFEDELGRYAAAKRDPSCLLDYSKLLRKAGKLRASERLLRRYVSAAKDIIGEEKLVERLKAAAEDAMASTFYEQAKILYDGYVAAVVKTFPVEEASFAIFEVADLYKKYGMYGEALEMFRRLARDYPGSELADDAALNTAFALAEEGRIEEAKIAFKDFIAEFQESELLRRALTELCLLEKEDAGEPELIRLASFLKDVIAMYPGRILGCQAVYELAKIFQLLGRQGEALAEYRRILDEWPSSEYAGSAERAVLRISGQPYIPALSD